jgi:hypothetical protein
MIVTFTITPEDREQARLDMARRYTSSSPVFAPFTVNPVAQALLRIGFLGVDAFQTYVVLTSKSPVIRRVVCSLTVNGDQGELDVPDQVLHALQAECNPTDFWVLDGKIPIPADTATWSEFYESSKRFLWITDVGDARVGNIRIKTVFFGFDDMAIVGEQRVGPPLLFGTMVFGGPLTGQEALHATWDEAEAGHRQMVERAKSELH